MTDVFSLESEKRNCMTDIVLDVTGSSWNTEVLEANGFVVVGFWAPWCSPCDAMLTAVGELAQEYGDRLKFVKLNIDQESGIASTYKITIVPTVIVFRGAQKLQEIICAVSKPQLQAVVQSLL